MFLTGAALAFPAGWTLAQKLDRPMMRIHVPVKPYDDDIGRRVQRLFDAMQPGRGLWRSNALRRASLALFAPRLEDDKRDFPKDEDRGYIRSERQCLIKLPRSQAIVFSIHTRIVRPESLTSEQRQALDENPIPDELS